MNHIYGQPKTSSSTYLGIVAIVIVSFVLGWSVGIEQTNTKAANQNLVVSGAEGNSEAVNLKVFWDAWEILADDYVEPNKLITQEMVYGAVRGMVASLGDPYTAFMTPKENREFVEALEGHLEGIGAELTLRNGLITVISPLKNSPAQNAGLLPEDIIYEVNGESTENMSLEEAVTRIRGEKGSTVVLGVIRSSSPEPVEISIVRQEINVNSVDWEVQGGIGILAINQFGDNTQAEFNRAVNEVLKQRPTGLVLDLRYNGGGYLDGAVEISSEFIEQGKVVTVKERDPQNDEVYYASGRARIPNLPMVVLINAGSASASEIVAGALQDYGRATIVGVQSFGKGTVQTVQNLVDGASLRVTIAKWFTPNDQNINETGITPDIEIEMTVEDVDAGVDPQLEKAIEILTSEKTDTSLVEG